jgi:hypothetical protein
VPVASESTTPPHRIATDAPALPPSIRQVKDQLRVDVGGARQIWSRRRRFGRWCPLRFGVNTLGVSDADRFGVDEEVRECGGSWDPGSMHSRRVAQTGSTSWRKNLTPTFTRIKFCQYRSVYRLHINLPCI